jgi:uncharacterized damage-inducible protein DinB
MDNNTGIIGRIEENFDGKPWHGTPLRRILDGVDDQRAVARPIPLGRTIAELLAHIIAWNEIVERRVRGENVEVTPQLDFPDPAGVTWSALVARLDAAHQRLLSTIRAVTPEDLKKIVPGQKYTARWMVDGLMHHNTYHAAQIAMLKKL